MSSNHKTSSNLHETTELGIDEPFDGDSTGVRAKVMMDSAPFDDETTGVRPKPRASEPPQAKFALPAWEDLTGLRNMSLPEGPASNPQWALDLVDAEQRRQQAMTPSSARGVLTGLAHGRGGGVDNVDPVEAPLPWVERFERDTETLLEAPEFDGTAAISELEERYAPSAQVPVPPPAPPSSLGAEPPGPPPSSRPLSTPRIPSSFPSPTPLPRFALGPRMEPLLGSERRPSSSAPAASVAPLSQGEPPRARMNPWFAGVLGAAISAAAGFALFWSPVGPSKVSSAPNAPPAPKQENVLPAAQGLAARMPATTVATRPFPRESATQLATQAGQRARACLRTNVPTAFQVVFSPDGSVMSAVADGTGKLGPNTGRCMDDAFSGIQIPAFDGDPQEIRLPRR